MYTINNRFDTILVVRDLYSRPNPNPNSNTYQLNQTLTLNFRLGQVKIEV
jgi:hypothetical protein